MAGRYVGNFPDGKIIPLLGFDRDKGAICLAVLRRDGFISLDAGPKEGTLFTEMFTLPPAALYVNADARRGEVRIEVVDAAGKPLVRSAPINSDSPRAKVTWKQDKINELGTQAVSLRFTLCNASLYSFWFAE